MKLVGQDPIVCWWKKDGATLEDSVHYGSTHSTNLLVRAFQPTDAGCYQVIASNAFGMSTSTVAQASVFCADASGTNPSAPFATWMTAATNLQDAGDLAMPGDVVVATNGVYNSGGSTADGILTNRVQVRYQVLLTSASGPEVTAIEGRRDSNGTNGPDAVRCAYVGGTLSGFTLRNGGTRASGFSSAQGGGAYAQGGVVAFCILSNNAAAVQGGGIYGGTLLNCVLKNNWSAATGGGASFSKLNNCLITANSAG